MGLGAVIYIPRLSEVNRGDTHTYRQQRDLISLLYFFKIRKVC
jgi:hypothetical protein